METGRSVVGAYMEVGATVETGRGYEFGGSACAIDYRRPPPGSGYDAGEI